MIGKLKLAVAALLTGTVIAGNVALATQLPQSAADDGDTAQNTYTVEADGTALTVDTKTLNFSATRGGRTWYSGKRDSENDGLNSLWVNKLTDAVTIGYKMMGTGNTRERTINMLKPKINFKERADGFDANINCRDISISFKFELRIKGNKLQVRIPYDSIREDDPEETKLEYLIVYPFFDSSYSLVDGQILLPDGSGAVIDLSAPTAAKQAYSARVYKWAT